MIKLSMYIYIVCTFLTFSLSPGKTERRKTKEQCAGSEAKNLKLLLRRRVKQNECSLFLLFASFAKKKCSSYSIIIVVIIIIIFLKE